MKKVVRYAIVLLAAVAFATWLLWAERVEAPSPIVGMTATPAGKPIPQLPPALAIQTPVGLYLQTQDGCGPYFNGTCVNLRSGPGTQFPVVMKLRDNMVLKVASSTEVDGELWYGIGFDTDVRYKDRVQGQWWISGAFVRTFKDAGNVWSSGPSSTSTKYILVDLSSQMLYAIDGTSTFMQAPVSTGLDLTPTPRGTFWIIRKVPDDYMQGPIPDVTDQYYDLPGVPWNLVFTNEGATIHGAYWHTHFGEPWSHGCVNLAPDQAERLYKWADPGTPIVIQE